MLFAVCDRFPATTSYALCAWQGLRTLEEDVTSTRSVQLPPFPFSSHGRAQSALPRGNFRAVRMRFAVSGALYFPDERKGDAGSTSMTRMRRAVIHGTAFLCFALISVRCCVRERAASKAGGRSGLIAPLLLCRAATCNVVKRCFHECSLLFVRMREHH